MPPPPPLTFTPPLLNSASPWATDATHLGALLACPSTGAITTRTALLAGFGHVPAVHRYAFFDPGRGAQRRAAAAAAAGGKGETYSYPDEPGLRLEGAGGRVDGGEAASLNNLGYSPLTLHEYLGILKGLSRELPATHHKTVIISVTGTPDDIATCYAAITAQIPEIAYPLAMEVNLSCPNIPGRPPPAYEADALAAYLAALPSQPAIPLGIKTPPYTHAGQFHTLVATLAAGGGGGEKLSFITATNTLGSCVLLDDRGEPVLPGDGMGGMAGAPLHPLALGNVRTIRRLLDERESLRSIKIIGIGGVSDGDGYKRMRAAGASAVGLATGLGRLGVEVFSTIEKDIESAW